MLAPVAVLRDWGAEAAMLRTRWRGILYIGTFMAMQLGLNNVSLQDISLTLNQIIRSAIPVVTCILAIAVEKKVPTRREVVSLVVLSVGVMVAVYQGNVGGRAYAIIFCFASTLCHGSMMTFSGKSAG